METELYRPDVVAGKYEPSLFDPTGQKLLVNEIFYSIQGEGRHAGRGCLFIRLAKCNLKCAFCDTEFEKYTVKTPADICLAALAELNKASLKGGFTSDVVVDLTGGEPALQNLKPLIEMLRTGGFMTIGCETSGSVNAPWFDMLDNVTCSPKVPKARLVDGVKHAATDFKWVVNKSFMTLYGRDPESVYIMCEGRNYLQPESNLPEWMEQCVTLIKRHPGRYRLSLQQHKYLGVR